jgi:hypothetical protein
MSRKNLIETASAHPEVIAIGLEVTLDPGRRRFYSPLVLMLADAAMQEIMRKITAVPPASGAPELADRDQSSTGE